MIGVWTINVSGRVYGPYTLDRMRTFAGEGRLGPHSLVSREGVADWHEAHDESEFTEFFADDGDATDAAKPAAESVQVALTAPDAHEAGKAHFTIVVNLKSRAPTGLEQAIMSFGTAHKLVPNVWIVSTDQTVNAVRNRLVQELGKPDSLFVVDATHGKAAWFNFGPEADVKIRRVWQKAS